MMTIGNRIKEMRLKNNLKQSELGKALHVTGATISSWEVGRTEPRMGMIENMCVFFNCSKSEFLENVIDTNSQHINLDEFTFINNKEIKDSFIKSIQRDTKFMEQIRLLWSLPADRKNEVYKNIAFQLYEIEKEQKEKESSLRA